MSFLRQEFFLSSSRKKLVYSPSTFSHFIAFVFADKPEIAFASVSLLSHKPILYRNKRVSHIRFERLKENKIVQFIDLIIPDNIVRPFLGGRKRF